MYNVFISENPEKMMGEKLIHYFSQGKCEGNAEMKNLLGGKGANLAEMCNVGIPVPPGSQFPPLLAKSIIKTIDLLLSK